MGKANVCFIFYASELKHITTLLKAISDNYKMNKIRFLKF